MPLKPRGRSANTKSKCEPDRGTDLSKDEIFDALSNHRRRYTLHYLRRHDGTAAIGGLSEAIAAWENDTSIENITSNERKRVYTALQQFHLPKMDRKGIVEYDQREGIVELTGAAATVDVYLDVVPENDIPWSQYYVGLSGICGVLLGTVLVGVFPFALIPDITWAFVVFALFAGSSLVHMYCDRQYARLGATDVPPDIPRR